MGFWVQNRSGVTETLVIVGDVAGIDRDVAIDPSWQLLGMAFPAGRELDKANLPATGTEDPTTADRVLVWDAASQSYQSAWYCGGPVCESWGEPWANHWLANDYSPTDISLSPGQGFWLQNRHIPFSWPNLRPAPDLQIAMDDGGFPALPGMTIQYRLTYSNTGNLSALGVVVSDTLPANTSFNPTASSPGWVQVGATDAYTYTAGMLDVGASGVVTYAVTVDSPLPPGTLSITNTAVISDTGYRGPDPNLADNQDGVSTLLSTGPTNVCGTISTDTTWTPYESPYVVTCNVTVNSGVTLTLQAGTVVKFQAGQSLVVNGNLKFQRNNNSLNLFHLQPRRQRGW